MADPTYAPTGLDVDIRPGMVLPLPDDVAATAARDRLSFMDLGVGGPTVTALGMLAEAVVFVAGVQGSSHPRPLLSTRVVLLTGSHAGGLVAGPSPDPRNGLPLQHLAVNAGAAIVTLEWQPAAAAIELEDAITGEQMDVALRAGFAEAERAADEGIELLVLAAGGAGASTAAAAVVAATTGAEPTTLIGRVATPAGLYDDNAWMTRCLALRDALHRVRDRDGDPRTVLAALGGADVAAATGLILGAAYRRTPVMIDGPVGAAAALLANDFSAQARRWVLLPDTGRHMAVRLAAEALDLHPWLDLCLDLGEGAAALAALPMLQTALTLSGAGEPVDPTPPTRFDSTGNQVFVGVARAVEPTPSGEEPAPGGAAGTAAVGTAAVGNAAVGTAAVGTAAVVAPRDGAAADARAAGPAPSGGASDGGASDEAAPAGAAEDTPTADKPAGERTAGSRALSSAAEDSAEGPDGAAAKAKATPAKGAKSAPAKTAPMRTVSAPKESPVKEAPAKAAAPRPVRPPKEVDTAANPLIAGSGDGKSDTPQSAPNASAPRADAAKAAIAAVTDAAKATVAAVAEEVKAALAEAEKAVETARANKAGDAKTADSKGAEARSAEGKTTDPKATDGRAGGDDKDPAEPGPNGDSGTDHDAATGEGEAGEGEAGEEMAAATVGGTEAGDRTAGPRQRKRG